MFSKLLGKKEPKKNELPTISPGLRSTMMTFLGNRGIPSMPSSAHRTFSLTVDPNATAKDFIDVIESDESMAARILKISNSVYFDRGTPSRDIEESVNKIGLNELRCILNANSLPELLPSNHSLRPQLWANDIATAIIARSIAGNLAPANVGTAFLAGLMHDIGKLLLLQRTDKEYGQVAALVKQDGRSFCSAEEEILAFNHCELGQVVGEKWNFTPDIITAIREHHNNWSDLSSSRPVSITAIVKAANCISHALGIGHGACFNKLRMACDERVDEAFSAIGLPVNQRKSLLEQYLRTFEMESEIYTFK